MATTARYNRNGWPLTLCRECCDVRYCEPHGTTAECNRCKRWTESVSIPFACGDALITLGKKGRESIVRDAKEK